MAADTELINAINLLIPAFGQNSVQGDKLFNRGYWLIYPPDKKSSCADRSDKEGTQTK